MTTSEILNLVVASDETDEELKHFAKTAKEAREAGVKNIICVFGDYDNDSRDLWNIPEVRQMCFRLIECGLISYLDYTTTLCLQPDPLLSSAFGAAEIYFCAHGKINVDLTMEDLQTLERTVKESNHRADKMYGPLLLNQENGK